MERPGVTPEAIVGEAARLFAERGYDQTHMRSIARRLGVTHAALYNHFPDKVGILVGVVRVAIDGLLEHLDEVAASDVPEEERFDTALRNHIRFIAEHVDVIATLFESEYALPDVTKAELRAFRRAYRDGLAVFVAQAQDGGRFLPMEPSLAVQAIFGAANSVYRWYRPGGPLSSQQLADQLAELLAHGYHTPAGRCPAATAREPTEAGLR